VYSYKILFLDVLFPMSLDKVIFVDAGKCDGVTFRTIAHQHVL
jgi:hypothetical protein